MGIAVQVHGVIPVWVSPFKYTDYCLCGYRRTSIRIIACVGIAVQVYGVLPVWVSPYKYTEYYLCGYRRTSTRSITCVGIAVQVHGSSCCCFRLPVPLDDVSPQDCFEPLHHVTLYRG